RHAACLRTARNLGIEIANAGSDEIEAVLARVNEAFARLAVEWDGDEEEDWTAALDEAAESLLPASEANARVLPTGLLDVDRICTSGLAPRTLTIVAAQTSRGKSSLAMQFGDELAARLADKSQAGIVRVISLEMGTLELNRRRLIATSGVPLEVWEGRSPA